jgi:Domain of unknown function (DUF1735)
MRMIKITTLFTAAVLLFAACVKNRGNMLTNGTSPSPLTVDFPNQLESKVLDIQTAPTTIPFYVEVNSSSGKSIPAIDVTIAKDATAVTNAGYEFLPDSTYQLLNTTATVDPATHLATFNLKLTTTKINLSHAYALGYKITSATGGAVLTTNKNNVVIAVGVKNIYDGVYLGRGYVLRAGDAVLTGHFSGVEFGLVTFGAYSNDFDHLQVWGDGVSGVGIGIPRITVDPATNLVTITSPGGAINMPGYPSRYVPATKTFYLGFTWGGGPGVREAYDTLVYLRPR